MYLLGLDISSAAIACLCISIMTLPLTSRSTIAIIAVVWLGAIIALISQLVLSMVARDNLCAYSIVWRVSCVASPATISSMGGVVTVLWLITRCTGVLCCSIGANIT